MFMCLSVSDYVSVFVYVCMSVCVNVCMSACVFVRNDVPEVTSLSCFKLACSPTD